MYTLFLTAFKTVICSYLIYKKWKLKKNILNSRGKINKKINGNICEVNRFKLTDTNCVNRTESNIKHSLHVIIITFN